MKIRLVDWRDRALLTPVREYLQVPVPGDLYELLRWPTYHVHAVWQSLPSDGAPAWRIVAYGVLGLCADGSAEATELIVLPSHRRQGLASWLRMVQCRDLEALGFPVLYQAATTADGQAWCGTHMDRVGTLPDGGGYYRATAEVMRERLTARGARAALPFHPGMLESTQKKAQAAWGHLAKLHTLADLQRAKLALRSA